MTELESLSFYLNGYNKFILDRNVNNMGKLKHKGSGLAIFLHEKFDSVVFRPDLSLSICDFEILCVEIISENIFVFSCYRSPNGNFDTFIVELDRLLVKLNDFRNHKGYIFGDMNVNLYNLTSKCRKYLDCIFSNNFIRYLPSEVF